MDSLKSRKGRTRSPRNKERNINPKTWLYNKGIHMHVYVLVGSYTQN